MSLLDRTLLLSSLHRFLALSWDFWQVSRQHLLWPLLESTQVNLRSWSRRMRKWKNKICFTADFHLDTFRGQLILCYTSLSSFSMHRQHPYCQRCYFLSQAAEQEVFSSTCLSIIGEVWLEIWHFLDLQQLSL